MRKYRLLFDLILYFIALTLLYPITDQLKADVLRSGSPSPFFIMFLIGNLPYLFFGLVLIRSFQPVESLMSGGEKN